MPLIHSEAVRFRRIVAGLLPAQYARPVSAYAVHTADMHLVVAFGVCSVKLSRMCSDVPVLTGMTGVRAVVAFGRMAVFW